MKKNFLVILTVLLQPALYAQKKAQARIDSLQQVLSTTKQDTTRIKTLNTLATDLLKDKADSAIELSTSALLLSKKINFKPGEAHAYITLGQVYAAKTKTKEALKNFSEAVKLYEMLRKPDEMAETYYAMALIHQRSNYEEALQLLIKAQNTANQTANKNLMGKVNYLTAVVLTRKGDFNEASIYNDQSIKYYTESGNQAGLANCYVVSARINQRRGNFQQSLKDNYAALRLFEQAGNKVGIYNVHTGLGIIYMDQKNFPEALNSYLAAKKAAEEHGNKEVLSGAYNNVGNTYLETGNNSEALKAFEESLKLSESVGDKKGIATAMGNLGIIYSRTGKPMEAIKSYEQTIKLYEQIGAREGISIAYMEIGRVYLNQKRMNESRPWLNKALQFAKQIDYKDVMSQCYQLLMQIDTAKGDYVSALANHKLHVAYRDSIANAGAAKQLIEQRMQYVFSKKEDSLRLQQALIAEQLEKQTLVTKEQQQALKLKQASLELAQKEKDVQMLSFLKTQAELQLSNEQNEKKLTLAEQDKVLQQSQLEKQTLLSTQKEQVLLLKEKELTAQRFQRNFSIAGAIVLFLLSFFIYSNYRNQRKANVQLQQQQIKTEQALKKLKATQAQLIQSEKMASLGELTTGIAHEIQNPLNFVNNFSELNDEMMDEMKQEFESGNLEYALEIAADIKENNSKITQHGKRAEGIVKAMLEHSKAGNGKKESTDINKLADEYLQLSYNGLRAKDKNFTANFKAELDEHINRMEVVPQDLGRVFLNLYNNAFYAVNEKKKTPALMEENYEPSVRVTTKRITSPSGQAGVEISIKDNGTGIPEKALDKIYQPFFTTKPPGQGTGLGLSLSYDIIKAHGGELKVETKEGEFTRFVIKLPELQ